MKEVHKVTVKSVFDKDVSVTSEDDRIVVSLQPGQSIDEDATQHWLKHGLIVTKVDYDTRRVWLAVLNQSIRNSKLGAEVKHESL